MHPETGDEKPKKEKEGDDEDDMEGDDMTDKLQDELDVADQFKDDLVPLALEYYLGVIDIDDQDDGEGSEGEGDDSDEDDKPKPKSKKKGGKKEAEMPLGPDGKP
jgi:hypothetical protein